MNVRQEQPEVNIEHAKMLLSKAAKNGADVLILPETWNTGFFPKSNPDVLSDKNGETVKALLEEISRTYEVFVIGGSVSVNENGKIFNTCYIYNEKGELVSSYRKTHLFSPMNEHLYFTAGDSLCTFSVGDTKAAVMICYDLRFPEIARRLALSGAEILFIPAQWPKERIQQMEILLKARAVENQMYTVLCNAVGTFDGTVFGGHSTFCDPFGNALSIQSEDEEILYCEADIDLVSSVRRKINVFADRREELY